MTAAERCTFYHNEPSGLMLCEAFHREYAYPRHTHEQYVICLIDEGVQSFTHRGTKHYTPPSGLIFINPQVVHTGEAATEHGFRLLSLYPTVEQMAQIAFELTGRHGQLPHFPQVRVDDAALARRVAAVRQRLNKEAGLLSAETHVTQLLCDIVSRYGTVRDRTVPRSAERQAVRQTRRFIDENYAQQFSLTDLAVQVGFSSYYLLRVFQAEVGMSPHEYLHDVRIRRAQERMMEGESLAEVAFSVGFSSQSHLTRRFKRAIGISPGKFARQMRR